MDEETRILTQLLRQKRESEGYSLRKLSSVVGVSFSTLARIERGEGKPDNNTKIRILEWLGKDARKAGLKFDRVALVHFRAKKQIDSNTVQCLLDVANFFKQKHNSHIYETEIPQDTFDMEEQPSTPLSKDQMELMAETLRSEIGLTKKQPIDPFLLKVDGVEVISIEKFYDANSDFRKQLTSISKKYWSAMSIPIDTNMERWVIVWNNSQYLTRQRATLLEEYWHIWLGHKPTKITKIASGYGRTFEQNEEHDAFYLATATLVPKNVITDFVNEKKDISKFAQEYGVSKQLIEYRIKRLGLWREYKGIGVTLDIEKNE